MQQATIDPLTGPAVGDVAALLDSFGLTSLPELSAVITSYARLRAWVPPMREQDRLPQELRITVAERTLYLPFPFAINEMWDQVDDLSNEVEIQRKSEAFWTQVH